VRPKKFKDNPQAAKFCESCEVSHGLLLVSALSIITLSFKSVSIIHRDVQAEHFKRYENSQPAWGWEWKDNTN